MSMGRHFRRAWAGLLCVAATGCTVFGIRTVEEASHEVLLRDGRFQIRQYADAVVAETFVDAEYDEASSTAFRRLAGYIFGKNERKEKIDMTAPVVQEPTSETIAMTAPVIQEESDKGWRMAFVLPSKYTLETAPKPLDPNLTVRQEPGKKVAVVRYSWRLSEARMQDYAEKLRQWLEERNYEAVSQPRSAAYDPPWTIPFLRRNEVHIDVK
jgi:hypothetical protein